VWSAGRKIDVNPLRLLVQRAKFSGSVMVSVDACYGGKGSLHFVLEKAKINADYYTNILLPKLIEDCNNVMPNGFIFQQDGVPAHTSRLAQDWLEQHSPDFIKNDEWPPNSPDLNPLDFHVWGAMLEKYNDHTPKLKNKAELTSANWHRHLFWVSHKQKNKMYFQIFNLQLFRIKDLIKYLRKVDGYNGQITYRIKY
jgi:hypothetical protein